MKCATVETKNLTASAFRDAPFWDSGRCQSQAADLRVRCVGSVWPRADGVRVLACCFIHHAAVMAATYQDAIVLFGDSLTQGSWEFNGIATRLAGKHFVPWSIDRALKHQCPDIYVRTLDVLNRGFSGYNTVWGIPVLRRVLISH